MAGWTPSDRWPPVYDFESLQGEIRRLAEPARYPGTFYVPISAAAPTVCQGDVVRLPAEVPMLGEDGAPIAEDRGVGHWLVIGNTCDFARPRGDTPFTQVVPVHDLAKEGPVGEDDLRTLRRYTYYRRFFLPVWPGGEEGAVHVADFTSPVTLDKRAFEGPCEVVARMTRNAWVLLHSCLVRFLARDDGRHD